MYIFDIISILERYLIDMVLWNPTRNIHLAIPSELLAEVDEHAKRMFMSRAEYIRFVLHKETSAVPLKPDAPGKPPPDPFEFLDLDDS